MGTLNRNSKTWYLEYVPLSLVFRAKYSLPQLNERKYSQSKGYASSQGQSTYNDSWTQISCLNPHISEGPSSEMAHLPLQSFLAKHITIQPISPHLSSCFPCSKEQALINHWQQNHHLDSVSMETRLASPVLSTSSVTIVKSLNHTSLCN